MHILDMAQNTHFSNEINHEVAKVQADPQLPNYVVSCGWNAYFYRPLLLAV